MLGKFIDLALRFRALVLGVVGVLIIAGLYAYNHLPIEAFPDIDDVHVQVITQSAGIAPEEMEQQITLPIERGLNGLPGMIRMRSISMFGLSVITLTFDDKTNDYFARQQVNERLQSVTLPAGIQPTLGALTDSIGEIYRYTLHAPHTSLTELKALEDWVIEPKLRTVPGVGDINGFGGMVKQYQVLLNPDKVRAYGLTTAQVFQALSTNNSNAGGSVIEHGQEAYTVRGLGLMKSLEDIGNVVVSAKGGTAILVKDLGEVRIGNQPRLGIVSHDDRDDVVEGIVVMRKGENASKVCAALQAKVDELNAHVLPPDVKIVPYYDRRDLVQHTVHTVGHNLLEGAGLVFIILVLFLGSIRCSLIVATIIPLSLLFAFFVLHLKGIPANLLSLGAVDFGIIVDGAVVMVEAIYVRMLEQGTEKPLSALQRASVVRRTAKEMGRPIFFSKLIIICALIPIFTFQRVEGRIFAPMAWTIGAALIGSLLLTITLIPSLSAMALGGRLKERPNPIVSGLERIYQPLMQWALHHRKRTIAIAAIALVATLALGMTLGTEFLPKLDEGNIWLTVELPIATSISEAKHVESLIRETVRSYPEVTQYVGQLGRPDDGTDPKGFNHMELSIDLKPREQWRSHFHQDKERLIADMNDRLSVIPGASFNFSQLIEDNVDESLSGVKGDIAVKLYGEDLDVLNTKGAQIQAAIAKVPGVADLDIEQQYGLPQLAVKVDRLACARHGINVSDVMDLIQTSIGGRAATTFFEGERRFDVIVRLKEEARSSLDKIGNLELSAADGHRVPLSQVAQVLVNQGAARITRENNTRRIAIKCSVRGRDQGGFVKEAQEAVARAVKIPPGYLITWEGQFENQERATARLAIIVPISLLLIFGLLVWAFGSLKNAFLILLNVPFALIGGLIALWAARVNLSVSAMVGFIALFGVSVENGVILVSRFNQLRAEGLSLVDAISKGTLSRLRPVVMTALMAGLGLLPAAVSQGIGSEVQRPLALVIVGGLVSATVLTLLVLPIIYGLFEDPQEE